MGQYSLADISPMGVVLWTSRLLGEDLEQRYPHLHAWLVVGAHALRVQALRGLHLHAWLLLWVRRYPHLHAGALLCGPQALGAPSTVSP